TIVDESDRSWCSSSAANDNRAITIECASDAIYPYAINANVWKSLIELCADICKRNTIKRLLWQADKGLVGQVNLQNMTAHRWFENKSCPGDYIYNRLGQIAKEVNQKLSGAPAGPFKPYQGQVNADDGLNCRTAPVSGSVIKAFEDGTVLTITKEDGNWGY
ncbi:N-acetylmuramoyl-L-alanine amidase, partial [Acutalibacter sp. JLR.KK004]